ncbi:MAG: hypothetical protein OIF50_13130 [Flavobacteriaceae bacterium]|nr:hypothetical protein [Flavobacteriaceae bacterium]
MVIQIAEGVSITGGEIDEVSEAQIIARTTEDTKYAKKVESYLPKVIEYNSSKIELEADIILTGGKVISLYLSGAPNKMAIGG